MQNTLDPHGLSPQRVPQPANSRAAHVLSPATFRAPPRGEGVLRLLVVEARTASAGPCGVPTEQLVLFPYDVDSDARQVTPYAPLTWAPTAAPLASRDCCEASGQLSAYADRLTHDAVVETLVRGAHFVLAADAAYTRPLAERHFPIFAERDWGCVWRSIPWQRAGILDQRDQAIMSAHACCAHLDDDSVRIGTLLRTVLPSSDKSVLDLVLYSSRDPFTRLAVRAGRMRDPRAFLERGYSWSGRRKVWYLDMSPWDRRSERLWLESRGAELVEDTPIAGIRRFCADPIPD